MISPTAFEGSMKPKPYLMLFIRDDTLTIYEDVSNKENLLDYINYIRNEYFTNTNTKIMLICYNDIYSFTITL